MMSSIKTFKVKIAHPLTHARKTKGRKEGRKETFSAGDVNLMSKVICLNFRACSLSEQVLVC